MVLGALLLIGACTDPSTPLDGSLGRDAAGSDARVPDADAGAGTPVCEAAAGAHCYYVDPARGDDTSDGSFLHPFRSQLPLVSYYADPPAGHVALQPGDCVYLLEGLHATTYDYTGYGHVAFLFRDVNGTAEHPIRLAAYPGHHPVITPDVPTVGIHLLQSAHWILDGLEVAHAYQSGIKIEESDHVTLTNTSIHDTDGVDNDNIAGLHLLTATHVEIATSTFHDNFDRTCADTGGVPTENSYNVVAFGGGDIDFHDNHVFNTPETSGGLHGGGIKYKHRRTLAGGTFVVRNNRFENCAFGAIASGTPNDTIEGNLIVDSDGIRIANHGGPTELTDIHIAYNTFVRSRSLVLDTADSQCCDVPPSAPLPTGIVMDHNVVVAPTSGAATGTLVSISTYGDDALFDTSTAAGVLSFHDNCYFDGAGPVAFDLFSAAHGPADDQGGLYSFAEWQALGYDGGSVQEDPGLDGASHATSSGCSAMGYDHAP